MSQASQRVTIGLPVYNGERFLAQAIESILAQTYTQFALVISDNGSTDRTQEICEAYAAKDNRICYKRYDENRGAAWNFNNLLEFTHTEYFKWQCYDDLLHPMMVEKCVAVLDREPEVVVAYPQAAVIDAQGGLVGTWADGAELRSARPSERMAHFLYHRNKGHLESQFGVMRTAPLRTTALMGAIPYSDQVFLVEMHLRGQFRELPEPLFIRRIHEGISTNANDMYALKFFLDPKRKGRISLQRPERLSEFVKAINRAKLGPAETLRCYAQLLPLTLSPANISKMGQDLRMAWRQVISNPER